MLSGNVVFKGDKEPVDGAIITFEKKTIGAITDANGDFLINNIPPGSYIIEVSYFSCKPLILNVKLEPNKKYSLYCHLFLETLEAEH